MVKTLFYSLARTKHPDIHTAMKAMSDVYMKAHLAAGEDSNARNEKGETPLHIAIKRRDWSKAKYLIKHGADKNAIDDNGDTALHMLMNLPDWNVWAILPMLNFLIKSGADLEVKDALGNSPLHLVAKQHPSCLGYMKLLLANADINSRDKLGHTPLHTAAWCGNKELVQCLVNYGANVNLVNHEDKTATDIAEEHQFYSISLSLKALQAKNAMTTSKTLVHQFDRLRVSTDGNTGGAGNDRIVSECANKIQNSKRRKSI